MRHPVTILIPALAASATLAACGGSSYGGGASSESVAPASAHASAVGTAANAKLGQTVLVDSAGMTLYSLSGEQNGHFICASAACEQVWHPLTLAAGATPSGSVSALGTVKRPDGAVQVTYKGSPLYTFARDSHPGEAGGEGIKDVGTWAAVTASAAPASSAPASSGSGGGGETTARRGYGGY